MKKTRSLFLITTAIVCLLTAPLFSAENELSSSFDMNIPLCAQIMDYNLSLMEQYAWDAEQEYKEDVEKMKIEGAKRRSEGISGKNDTYTPSGGAPGCNPGCLVGWMGDIDWDEMLVPCSWSLGCGIALFAVIYVSGVFKTAE